MKRISIAVLVSLVIAGLFAAGELDNAVLHGETDKARAIDYRPGEMMTFTLTLQGAKPLPPDTYFIDWKRTGDDGVHESGKVPASLTTPLVIKTKIDKPGFVRLFAVVVDKNGKQYRKSFNGDVSTPEGKKAMNRFERKDKRVFFDGGAGVEPEKLESVPEPEDFDAFWARRKARLAKVPLEAEKKELKGYKEGFRVYAVSIKCAGAHPSTGYLTIPDKPGKYPVRVSFHGYGHIYPNKGTAMNLVGSQNIMMSYSARSARAGVPSALTRSRMPIRRQAISAATPIASCERLSGLKPCRSGTARIWSSAADRWGGSNRSGLQALTQM